jgi:hypothetical protein
MGGKDVDVTLPAFDTACAARSDHTPSATMRFAPPATVPPVSLARRSSTAHTARTMQRIPTATYTRPEQRAQEVERTGQGLQAPLVSSKNAAAQVPQR